MSWREVCLGEISKMLSGGTPRKSIDEYWNGDIPWVSAKDLKQHFISGSQLYITEEGAKNGTRMVPKNTVLFVVRGMSLAKEFRVSFSKVPVAFNQDLKALKCDSDIDSKFVFYSLLAQRDRIRQLAGEAAHGTKKLPTEVVEKIPLKIPDSKLEQIKISSFAGIYDELIENNHRRIKLLEESSRLLFREWFVNLRFPGHENVKIIDGVPAMWSKSSLGEILEIKKGKNITKATVEPGVIPVVAGGLKPAYFHNTSNVKGPVITVSASGANAGYVNLYQQDIWASDCSYIDCEMDNDIYFRYLLLKNFQTEIFGMQHGAAQPHVYPNDLARLIVLQPTRNLIVLFNEFVTDQFRLIHKLDKTNAQLESVRDILLPRLMKGELTV